MAGQVDRVSTHPVSRRSRDRDRTETGRLLPTDAADFRRLTHPHTFRRALAGEQAQVDLAARALARAPQACIPAIYQLAHRLASAARY